MKAYPSFLHYKRQKVLHKAAKAMENNVDIQCNKLFTLGRLNGPIWYI